MRNKYRVCFLATLSVLCVLQVVSAQQRGRRGQANQDQTNPSAAQAQPPAQPQPRGIQPKVFAITGARVIPEPGKSIEKATVVIRNGLVEAVGPDAAAPVDAIKIDGDGMTVYPGFVDAVSHWGFDNALRRSETGPSVAEDFASEALAATKADNRKGLTPEFVVNTAFVVDEEQSNGWRAAGFTAHLVAPDGGIVTGQSALVSLNGAAPAITRVRSWASSPTPGRRCSTRGIINDNMPPSSVAVASGCARRSTRRSPRSGPFSRANSRSSSRRTLATRSIAPSISPPNSSSSRSFMAAVRRGKWPNG
jgi:hypothetical protein